MALDLIGGIPHIAVPAFIGSLIAELSGAEHAIYGAVIGIAVYFIAKFLVTDVVKRFNLLNHNNCH